ncbi:MAG: hypothetical protein WC595_00435 [Candidatus Nanoarchaeia archaeon]
MSRKAAILTMKYSSGILGFGVKADRVELTFYELARPSADKPADFRIEAAMAAEMSSGKVLAMKTVESARDIGSLATELAAAHSGRVEWTGPIAAKVVYPVTATDLVLSHYFQPCQQP